MNKRIKKLTELTLSGEMYPTYTKVEFDRTDLFLDEHQKQAKRICDYIMWQRCVITEFQTMTGNFKLDSGDVPGPFMNHWTLKNTCEALNAFYNKPMDNLATFEWMHAAADFEKIIHLGIKGLIGDIEYAKEKYGNDAEKISFLNALKTVAEALVKWANKCSDDVLEFAHGVDNEKHRKNLLILSKTLKKIPEYPARNFYEAVLSIYILFSFEPDSIGTLDRTLYYFYINDIKTVIWTEKGQKKFCRSCF